MTDTMKLTDRLRGIYVLPVNDGAGLLDGKDTFTREFPVAPIQKEAAEVIDRLRTVLADIAVMTDGSNSESYRSDDREGCLETIHELSLAALKQIPS